MSKYKYCPDKVNGAIRPVIAVTMIKVVTESIYH